MLKKQEIINKIKEILWKHDEIIFVYIHGSFTETFFRDIDIAVYIDENKVK